MTVPMEVVPTWVCEAPVTIEMTRAYGTSRMNSLQSGSEYLGWHLRLLKIAGKLDKAPMISPEADRLGCDPRIPSPFPKIRHARFTYATTRRVRMSFGRLLIHNVFFVINGLQR